MSTLQLDIPYQPPFALRFHREGELVQRGFWLNGAPVVVRLWQDEDNGPVRAHVATVPEGRLDAAVVLKTVRHMIAAPDDLSDFRAAVAGDQRMIRLIDALPGHKPLRVPDLWTTLMRSLISQQISTAAARSIRENLSRRYGRVIRFDEDEVSILPAPDVIVQLSAEEFAAAGFSGRKAEYARGFAEAFLSGQIDPERLAHEPPEQMIAELTKLRGVGVWTAECVGIFCLGHRDLLPADDLGVQKAITQLYGLKRDPSPKQVIKLGAKWAGWRSYAAIYLWGSRNHRVLPEARIEPKRTVKKAKISKPGVKKPAKLPPLRTGAKHHTPVAPGRRGR
jgi:DNA-3-methyladenine glycosylase II